MKIHFLCKFNIQPHLDTFVNFDEKWFVGYFKSLISKTPYCGKTLSILPNYGSTNKGNCHPLTFWQYLWDILYEKWSEGMFTIEFIWVSVISNPWILFLDNCINRHIWSNISTRQKITATQIYFVSSYNF